MDRKPFTNMALYKKSQKAKFHIQLNQTDQKDMRVGFRNAMILGSWPQSVYRGTGTSQFHLEENKSTPFLSLSRH